MHSLLPMLAQRILQDAAETEPSLDNFARRKAVDAAVARVRRQFPQYFREDDGGDTRGSK